MALPGELGKTPASGESAAPAAHAVKRMRGRAAPPPFDPTPRPIPGYAGETTVGGGEGHGGGGGGGGNTAGAVRRTPAPPARSGGLDLRQIFTGPVLRSIVGLPTKMADVVLGKIKHPDGASVTAVAKDRSDVYVAFQDIVSSLFGIGRLYSPGNALWRLPQSGDSCMVLKPSEADGTGVPYVMFGDGGSKQAVPAWLDDQNSGTFVLENWNIDAGGTVRIRSQANQDGSQAAVGATVYLKPDGTLAVSAGQGVNVTIDTSAGGSVVLNGGVLKVARITDQVQGNAGPYPIVNGLISGPGAPFVKA